jgi:Cu/Ag efflux pump CusA
MWLTLIAMRNGIAILMCSLAIVLLGATSLSRTPVDLFPNINFPSIRIGTIYKGANVQDIERTVTYPIEEGGFCGGGRPLRGVALAAGAVGGRGAVQLGL